MKLVELTHAKVQCRDKWLLEVDGEMILQTGSSVRILRALRKLRVAIPEILGTLDAWNKEYYLRWSPETGLWA